MSVAYAAEELQILETLRRERDLLIGWLTWLMQLCADQGGPMAQSLEAVLALLPRLSVEGESLVERVNAYLKAPGE